MLGSGKASEAIWTVFDTMTTAVYRLLRHTLRIAWTRVVDAGAGFATIGTSVVGGTDIVRGQISAVTPTDIFTYFDETDRAVRIEYDRELQELQGGIGMAILDIVLENSDGRFTPDQNATIGTALLPNRPTQAYLGFYLEGTTKKTVPVFKGVTKMPRPDKMRKTVEITCIDYVKYLDEIALESSIYTDQRSDQIIADILSDAGFGTSQYSLDEGLNTIGFAWFDKGDTAGERIRRICEAEEAVFYQDEEGILRFENRRKYAVSPYSTTVWTIDEKDIINWQDGNATDVVNKVFIEAQPREVQAETEIWRDAQEEVIPAGDTLEIWAQYETPATTVSNPSATTDYTAFTGSGGTGSDITSDISIVITSFTTTVKLEITNNSGGTAYVNFLRLTGTPATVTGEILVVAQDSVSISKYDERVLNIKNDFIDNDSFATYLAKAIVTKYADPRRIIRIEVQGIPHLQLRDKVSVQDPDTDAYKTYRVMRVQGIFDGGYFSQKLTLREVTDFEADSWAIVGTTQIGATDEFVGI